MNTLESYFLDDSDLIKSKIRQRRAQMLVHSCIYYSMNTNIVDDDTWQRWANELSDLQRENPDCCKISFYDKAFVDWTGDSGAFLPLRDRWVRYKAQQLLDTWEKFND